MRSGLRRSMRSANSSYPIVPRNLPAFQSFAPSLVSSVLLLIRVSINCDKFSFTKCAHKL